ncbi:MAG TPA: DUF4038 domain-containing protein [Chryseosolibacter sp.]
MIIRRMPVNLIITILFLASQQAIAQKQVRKWEVFEITLVAKKKYPNPYADIPAGNSEDGLVKVEFKGTSGEAKGQTVRVFGFWYGGQTWKARFAPPQSGTWEYHSISIDKGLGQAKGKIEVVEWAEEEKASNPTRRGFVQVMKTGPEGGHFFRYADGTPFLWVGDTWWNWTQKKIKFETFRTLVDDRSEKGFTVGQLFVPGNGWGGESSSMLDKTYSILDTAHMRKVEQMIAYANSKGITVWVHGWWARKDLDKTIGPEKMRRWWRYLVDRLGAYNVIWVIGGEYNMFNYGGLGIRFWSELGQLIKDEDPYDRIVSGHNTPPGWDGGAEAPQWSTAEVFHKEQWLDYNQSQVGHGRWYNEMIPDVVAEAYARIPAKPIVVTEPWYEFVEGNPTAMDIRFAAWGAMMSGAAGHTYGGGHVWLAHVPESPAGGGPWPLEKGFENNTFDYPGARSMSYFAGFFRNVEWWKMAPHPELLHEYADKYCIAVPGEEYVVYLRWGGNMKVDLRPSSESDTFEYTWYDPDSGKALPVKTVKGGDIREFHSPGGFPSQPHFKDWVLRVKKI